MEDIEKQYTERFPEKDFIKRTFPFSTQELRELSSMDTIIKMGQMAQMMSNNYVQGPPMQRVKAKNSPDVGLLYSVEKGEFYVWEPKLWCSMCTNRRAINEYENKILCADCTEVLRNEEVKKIEELPKKKSKS